MAVSLAPGEIVTLRWARNYPKEDAPLFILLDIPYIPSAPSDRETVELALTYCYFDPTDLGWLGLICTLSVTQLMRVRSF